MASDQWNPGQMGNPLDWHPGVDAGQDALDGNPSRTSPYHTTDDWGGKGEGKLDMKTAKQRKADEDEEEERQKKISQAHKEGQMRHLGGSNI